MLLSKFTRNVVVSHYRRSYAKKPRECPPHMNELPIPCGPWDPWYKGKQNTYNTILVLGVAWFCFSLGLMAYSGSVYLNWSPPALPGPPSDIECDDSAS